MYAAVNIIELLKLLKTTFRMKTCCCLFFILFLHIFAALFGPFLWWVASKRRYQNKFDPVDPLALQVFYFASKSQLCANRAPKVPSLTPHDGQPHQPPEGFLQAGALQKKTDNDSVTKGQSPAKKCLKTPNILLCPFDCTGKRAT